MPDMKLLLPYIGCPFHTFQLSWCSKTSTRSYGLLIIFHSTSPFLIDQTRQSSNDIANSIANLPGYMNQFHQFKPLKIKTPYIMPTETKSFTLLSQSICQKQVPFRVLLRTISLCSRLPSGVKSKIILNIGSTVFFLTYPFYLYVLPSLTFIQQNKICR